MKEQILAVQRMQDYIEKNRTEEISLSDLAKGSMFSPWYSYRLFRDALGLTPTEYIRKYRLTQAAKQLRSGTVKVIDRVFTRGIASDHCRCKRKGTKVSADMGSHLSYGNARWTDRYCVAAQGGVWSF